MAVFFIRISEWPIRTARKWMAIAAFVRYVVVFGQHVSAVKGYEADNASYVSAKRGYNFVERGYVVFFGEAFCWVNLNLPYLPLVHAHAHAVLPGELQAQGRSLHGFKLHLRPAVLHHLPAIVGIAFFPLAILQVLDNE